MRLRRIVFICLFASVFSALFVFSVQPTVAQCAMCTLNADESVRGENTQGQGLNKGILFLLSMPFLAVGALGYLWYTRYRKDDRLKSVDSKSTVEGI